MYLGRMKIEKASVTKQNAQGPHLMGVFDPPRGPSNDPSKGLPGLYTAKKKG
jgi:hypothetical protein